MAQVDLWLIDIERDGPTFARLARCRGVLSATDTRRLAAYRRAADAMAFAASRAGLHQVLERFGAAPDARLQSSRSGKPFVPGVPPFSLSRTRGHVLIGVNPVGGIGIDVETVRPLELRHRLFGRVAALLGDRWPADRRTTAAWTVVEAWVKLHGLTLAGLLDSPAHQRELENALGRRWNDVLLTVPRLPAGLVGACWTTGPVASIELHDLRPVEPSPAGGRASADGRIAGPQSYPNAPA